MLSQIQMVRFRKQIEKLYDSVCAVVVAQEQILDNGVSTFVDKIILENQPCRISQQSITQANNNGAVTEADKVISLYIAPEVDVPAGSKILVTYNNITDEYRRTGFPSRYDAYQKIQLEYVGRWI